MNSLAVPLLGCLNCGMARRFSIQQFRAFVRSVEGGIQPGATFQNTSRTELLVCLRNISPGVKPDAPTVGAPHRRSNSS
jgi:hypothetical protein